MNWKPWCRWYEQKQRADDRREVYTQHDMDITASDVEEMSDHGRLSTHEMQKYEPLQPAPDPTDCQFCGVPTTEPTYCSVCREMYNAIVNRKYWTRLHCDWEREQAGKHKMISGELH